jgi:hypothetical protein
MRLGSHYPRPARDREGLLTLFETGLSSDRQAGGAQAIGDLARAGGLELAAEQGLDVGRLGAGELGDDANVIAVPPQPWLELIELRRQNGLDQLRSDRPLADLEALFRERG